MMLGDDPGEMPPGNVDVGGPAKQVSGGEAFTCAVLQDDTLRCWGLGSAGQLATGAAQNIDWNDMPPDPIELF